MPAASVALAPDPVERPHRWGDLGLRTVSALILGPIVVACVWSGGAIFAVIVGLATVGLAVEWWLLLGCGRRHRQACLAWAAVGLGYVVIASAAFL